MCLGTGVKMLMLIGSMLTPPLKSQVGGEQSELKPRRACSQLTGDDEAERKALFSTMGSDWWWLPTLAPKPVGLPRTHRQQRGLGGLLPRVTCQGLGFNFAC